MSDIIYNVIVKNSDDPYCFHWTESVKMTKSLDKASEEARKYPLTGDNMYFPVVEKLKYSDDTEQYEISERLYVSPRQIGLEDTDLRLHSEAFKAWADGDDMNPLELSISVSAKIIGGRDISDVIYAKVSKTVASDSETNCGLTVKDSRCRYKFDFRFYGRDGQELQPSGQMTTYIGALYGTDGLLEKAAWWQMDNFRDYFKTISEKYEHDQIAD